MRLSSLTLTPESIVSTVSSTSLSGIVKVKTTSVEVLAASSFSHVTPEPVTNVTVFHVGGRTVTVTFVPAVADVTLANATTSSAAVIETEWGTGSPVSSVSLQAARQNTNADNIIAAIISAVIIFLRIFQKQGVPKILYFKYLPVVGPGRTL